MKALWNLPTTRAALSFVRSSPVMRRLCGWESIADIPHEMMQRASERFDYFYDLADAGYDASVIKNVSRGLGHEPIIDRNARRGAKKVFLHLMFGLLVIMAEQILKLTT